MAFVKERKQLKIFVSLDAKKVVADFAEKFDMTEHGVASRFYRWFGTLPEPVQKWIVGLTDGAEGDGIATFARELMARSGRPPYPSIPPDAPTTHALPDLTLVEPPKENSKNSRGGRSK